ncbi:hypothetical protein [Rufibacter psychrotolerans]|uniref:hypothetical protein n=1 Tax=Rufibacter psychrotolerans TaxID=2812556 RepID=UPI0019673876|nr:hypothetical protein [Rufibacter sp. SYSU D00308]
MDNAITLWFYFRSASPIYTYTLTPTDARLTRVLEDVRKVQHGNHVFIHLRSEYEWSRAMDSLNLTPEEAKHAVFPAA